MNPERAKILVVDDDPRITGLLVETLSAIGYPTRGVQSAREALQKIPEYQPDILVSDLRMPEMDGFSLLREIKKVYPEILIVTITGEQLNDLEREAAALSADGFLTKPFRFEKIEELIEGLWANRSRGRTPAIQTKCILIIDDDPEFRLTTSELLQQAGFETLTAADAQQGLSLLATRNIQAVIVDVVMPGLSGLQLVRIIKNRFPQLPMVLVSGRVKDLALSEDELTGADAFLDKPISLRRLQAVLEKFPKPADASSTIS